jgi:hypothetical protein
MPHDLVIDGIHHELREVLDLGRAGARLRVHKLPEGDAVLLTSAAATRDGFPLLGNLGVVCRGEGALVRLQGLRVEVAWRDAAGARPADATDRCRLCLAAFTPDEEAIVCRCEVVFHRDCARVLITCPGCGTGAETMP